jgi:hypothetical protein
MCFTFTVEANVPIVEMLDGYGKAAWIALIVLGFWTFWPIGLTALAFVLFSGRVRAWKHQSRGQWYNMQSGNGRGFRCGGRMYSSGNAAFDEYRAETIRRLEEEQKEFVEYLEKLRKAKDKAEFDQFMADRRSRPEAA